MAPLPASRVLQGDAGQPPPQLAPVGTIEGWAPAPTPPDGWRPRYLQPSAERFVTFTKDGREVGVFIAYYRNQTFDRKLVSSENVLVTSNDQRWMQLDAGERDVASQVPP
ncbi:MAG: EpsI family protein [Betaproteobacteria bacterium]|nr:EpsI family protein [Betaproteobacteria bacterium]